MWISINRIFCDLFNKYSPVSDNAFYYTSYVTNDTSHPILGMYSQHKQLTTKLDDKWFNSEYISFVLNFEI